MGIYGIDSGLPFTESYILSDTSATTVLDATSRGLTLAGLKLVNKSGGPLTPVVDVYKAGTAYVLRDNASLADTADDIVSLPADYYALPKGALLRVTANAGLHVHVSYLENPRPRS